MSPSMVPTPAVQRNDRRLEACRWELGPLAPRPTPSAGPLALLIWALLVSQAQAAAPLEGLEAFAEPFSGHIAVLPAPGFGELSGPPAGRALAEAGLGPHLFMLSSDQLADTNFFNARRFPVAFHLGFESYFQNVKRPGDGDAAMRHYLAEGGTLLVLPCGPYPLYYSEEGKPVNGAAGIGIHIGAGAFESPPPGLNLTFRVNTNQPVIRWPERAFAYPAAHEADPRWRPSRPSGHPDIRYTPMATLFDDKDTNHGDAAVLLEFTQGPLRGGRVVYVWGSLLAAENRCATVVSDLLRWALGNSAKPPGWLRDDFEGRGGLTEGGTIWNVQDGQWKLDQGTLLGQDAVSDSYEIKGVTRGNLAWRDCRLSLRFKVERRGSDWRDGPWIGLRCRPDGDGYYLHFTDRDCQWHKVLYGISTSEANPIARAPWKPDNAFHLLQVTAQDNRLKADLDGRVLFDAKDDAHLDLPSLRSGGILLAARKGSRSQGNTVVRFDDVAVEFLKSQDPSNAVGLAQSGPAALPLLNRALGLDGRQTALGAWALAQHPQPGAAPALRRLLWQADQVAGYWAAKALGRLADQENVKALAALLPDERLGFWELSAGGVGRITDVHGRGGRRWAEAQEWMPNLRVAYAAMEALGEIGGDKAAATLLRALDNDQYLVRYGAARGLGRMRHAPAEARLRDVAERDPVLIVRLGAQQALALIRSGAADNAARILDTAPFFVPFPTPRPGAERENPRQPERSSVTPGEDPANGCCPPLPAIAFIKTANRSESNFGFRDSYFFPKTPKYHSGENVYALKPPRPDGTVRNLTQLTNGEVQGLEVSFDGAKLLFAMRRDRQRDGFHIFEMNTDGTGLRQLTEGNCNDVDPCYLPDGRIAFCSDRAGWQEYYHQERSRVIHMMNSDGSGIQPITFNPNQDYEPLVLRDGRLLYGSYRFYAQDGSEGPIRGEWMGLARIETVLRAANPDGSSDNLHYGAMRGSFFSPLRPMPFGDQWAGWHKRGYHVGVSVSQPREMTDGRIVCLTPAGLTLVDPNRVPVDCEMPVYPEVVNLAGGEEVYIHNYDEMNPVGRYTAPYPVAGDWILVSHAPWHDLRANGYGLYWMNVATRELKLVFDDPQMADVDPVPLLPRQKPVARISNLPRNRRTGLVYCNSVFNSDLPFNRSAVQFVRVLEGVQMGQSIAANAAFRTRVLGTLPIHPDGSFYVEVPADVPLRFELLDGDGQMLVHETEFNSVRPGEVKGCIGCHEPRKQGSLNARPAALDEAPVRATPQRGDLIYMGKPTRPYNAIYRD